MRKYDLIVTHFAVDHGFEVMDGNDILKNIFDNESIEEIKILRRAILEISKMSEKEIEKFFVDELRVSYYPGDMKSWFDKFLKKCDALGINSHY